MDDTMMAAIVSSMIALATSMFVLALELRAGRKKEFRDQMMKEYDGLTEALCKYNFACIDITSRDTSSKNVRATNLECQTIFFELQYQFWRPLLIRDEQLQKMLGKMGEQNVVMSANVLEKANSGEVGMIDDGFMDDQTDIVKEISTYLGDEIKEMTLGWEEKAKRWFKSHFGRPGSSR